MQNSDIYQQTIKESYSTQPNMKHTLFSNYNSNINRDDDQKNDYFNKYQLSHKMQEQIHNLYQKRENCEYRNKQIRRTEKPLNNSSKSKVTVFKKFSEKPPGPSTYQHKPHASTVVPFKFRANTDQHAYIQKPNYIDCNQLDIQDTDQKVYQTLQYRNTTSQLSQKEKQLRNYNTEFINLQKGQAKCNVSRFSCQSPRKCMQQDKKLDDVDFPDMDKINQHFDHNKGYIVQGPRFYKYDDDAQFQWLETYLNEELFDKNKQIQLDIYDQMMEYFKESIYNLEGKALFKKLTKYTYKHFKNMYYQQFMDKLSQQELIYWQIYKNESFIHVMNQNCNFSKQRADVLLKQLNKIQDNLKIFDNLKQQIENITQDSIKNDVQTLKSLILSCKIPRRDIQL